MEKVVLIEALNVTLLVALAYVIRLIEYLFRQSLNRNTVMVVTLNKAPFSNVVKNDRSSGHFKTITNDTNKPKLK